MRVQESNSDIDLDPEIPEIKFLEDSDSDLEY